MWSVSYFLNLKIGTAFDQRYKRKIHTVLVLCGLCLVRGNVWQEMKCAHFNTLTHWWILFLGLDSVPYCVFTQLPQPSLAVTKWNQIHIVSCYFLYCVFSAGEKCICDSQRLKPFLQLDYTWKKLQTPIYFNVKHQVSWRNRFVSTESNVR